MRPHFILCKLCNEEISYVSGHFSLHLKDKHNLSREEYIVQTEFNGIHPKCQCGFCEDDSTFLNRKNIFLDINFNHRSFDWLKEKHIEKYGIPKCQNTECQNSVLFHRGVPNKYCCKKCKPGSWNQEQVKKNCKRKI